MTLFPDLILLPLAGLAIFMIIEDARSTWVSLWAVLAFFGLGLLRSLIGALNAPGVDPSLTIALPSFLGLMIGWGLGQATRAYIHWRTGLPGFGAADILLLGAIGAMLGPFLIGPFILTACALAIVLALGLPVLFGRREEALEDTPGGETEAMGLVLPFCPALLVGWGVFEGLILAGIITPSTPF